MNAVFPPSLSWYEYIVINTTITEGLPEARHSLANVEKARRDRRTGVHQKQRKNEELYLSTKKEGRPCPHKQLSFRGCRLESDREAPLKRTVFRCFSVRMLPTQIVPRRTATDTGDRKQETCIHMESPLFLVSLTAQ